MGYIYIYIDITGILWGYAGNQTLEIPELKMEVYNWENYETQDKHIYIYIVGWWFQL